MARNDTLTLASLSLTVPVVRRNMCDPKIIHIRVRILF